MSGGKIADDYVVEDNLKRLLLLAVVTQASYSLFRKRGTVGRIVGLRAFMSAVRVFRLPASRSGKGGPESLPE